jgi:hypothetical protein
MLVSLGGGVGIGAAVIIHVLPLEVAPSRFFPSTSRTKAEWSWFATMVQSAPKVDQELAPAAPLDPQGICQSAPSPVTSQNSLRKALRSSVTEFLPFFHGDQGPSAKLHTVYQVRCEPKPPSWLPGSFSAQGT